MELTKILRRRWVTTTLMVASSLVIICAAYMILPSTYQAKANILFLPSKNLSKTYGGNPYLAFNSTLNQTADVIRYEVTDADTAQGLAAAGYTQAYTVTDVFDTSAPVLLVTVTGSNKAAVEHTEAGVTQEISNKLKQQQKSLPSYDAVGSTVISFTTNPTAVSSKKLRSLLVVAAVCFLLIIAIPVVIDGVALRRRTRRSGQSGSGTTGPDGIPSPNGADDSRGQRSYRVRKPGFADALSSNSRASLSNREEAQHRDQDRGSWDDGRRGTSREMITSREHWGRN